MQGDEFNYYMLFSVIYSLNDCKLQQRIRESAMESKKSIYLDIRRLEEDGCTWCTVPSLI